MIVDLAVVGAVVKRDVNSLLLDQMPENLISVLVQSCLDQMADGPLPLAGL